MAVYILRLEKPLGNERHSAQYYIGYAEDERLDSRIAEHRTGQGSHFTAAACREQIDFHVVAVLPGATRFDEWRIKQVGKVTRVLDWLAAGRLQWGQDYLDDLFAAGSINYCGHTIVRTPGENFSLPELGKTVGSLKMAYAVIEYTFIDQIDTYGYTIINGHQVTRNGRRFSVSGKGKAYRNIGTAYNAAFA